MISLWFALECDPHYMNTAHVVKPPIKDTLEEDKPPNKGHTKMYSSNGYQLYAPLPPLREGVGGGRGLGNMKI